MQLSEFSHILNKTKNVNESDPLQFYQDIRWRKIRMMGLLQSEKVCWYILSHCDAQIFNMCAKADRSITSIV